MPAADLPPLSSDRAVTRIDHAGRLICVVVHDPAVIDGARVHQVLGATARLALENERLRAELLAKLDEVRASRATGRRGAGHGPGESGA